MSGLATLSRLGVALLCLATPCLAQSRQLTGVVTRTGDGRPIADVVVALAGSGTTTTTNAEGRYQIAVPAGEVRIAFRAIGFTRREAVVPAGQNTLDVVLAADVFKLDEVVVSGQTTTLERRTATRAVATVAAEELARAPAASLEQALQGKVLGASISMNSGAPGGGAQIQIRGASTILGNGQPLFVVDGVMIDNSSIALGTNSVTGAAGGIGNTQDQVLNRVADLNPSEIENIEVLKGASATAIYGSRATNGVVLITTKRGRPDQAPAVTISQRVGFSQPMRLLGTRCFGSLDEALEGLEWWGASPEATARATEAFAGGAAPCVDHAKAFYNANKNPSYATTVSVGGGSDRTQYFATVTNDREEGLATRTNRSLSAVRVNIDQRLGSRWTTSFGLNFTRNLARRGLGNNDNTFTSPVYNFAYTPSYWDLQRRDENGNYVTNPFPAAGAGASSNPFETFDLLTADEKVWRQIANGTVKFQPLTTERSHLELSLLAGLDRWQIDGFVYSPAYLQYEQRPGFGGAVVQTNSNQLSYNARLSAIYTYSPNTGTSITTSLGAALENQDVNVYRLRARQLLPGVETFTQGVQANEQTLTRFEDQALFADAQLLGLGQKLVLTGGVRADRSSANGDNRTFYVYPRASGAYTIGSVGGLVENLKLRGSWGRSGNRPNFGLRFITFPQSRTVDGRAGVVTNQTVGNSAIRPETLTEIEGGLDATLFKGRVQLEASAYRRTIEDLLLQPQFGPSAGLTVQAINGGELRTRGVEAGATFNVLSSRSLNWLSRVTFQRYTQETISIPSAQAPFFAGGSFGADFGRNRICAGCKTTAIWGKAPVDAERRMLDRYATLTAPGSVAAIVDTIIGDANPDFQVFFTHNIEFKRLSVSAQIDWRKGGDVANLTETLRDEGGTTADWADPSPVSGVTMGQFRYLAWAGGSAGVYVQDGSYLRLRDVAVSYEAPGRVASIFGAKSARFSLQGRNLFMISGYRGFDPEFNNFGNTNLNRFIDLAPYPQARSFHFSVDLRY